MNYHANFEGVDFGYDLELRRSKLVRDAALLALSGVVFGLGHFLAYAVLRRAVSVR